MNNQRAILLLEKQIEICRELGKQKLPSSEWREWQRDTEILIEKVFGSRSRHLPDFQKILWVPRFSGVGDYPEKHYRTYAGGVLSAQAVLKSMISEVRDFGIDRAGNDGTCLERTETVVGKFHLVARQLQSRHGDRLTIQVEDEYDVQDLLHALLHLVSDDIRREEWTPSYAGGSSRIDFLLKKEETLVEVKKTRKGLAAKEVGDQLLVDIGRYQAHPNCKRLVCFVYDPEGRIGNPVGLERDLTKTHGELPVTVIVAPKGN